MRDETLEAWCVRDVCEGDWLRAELHVRDHTAPDDYVLPLLLPARSRLGQMVYVQEDGEPFIGDDVRRLVALTPL
jgi:hypothetical protein